MCVRACSAERVCCGQIKTNNESYLLTVLTLSDHYRTNGDCWGQEEDVEIGGDDALEGVEPAPGGENIEGHQDRAPRAETFHWGAFRFTPKGHPDSERFGWEVSCPFHWKSEKTGRKQFLSAAVAGSSDRAIPASKHWCNAALDVDRQWKHFTAVDIHGELPGEAMIEAKKIPEYAFLLDSIQI